MSTTLEASPSWWYSFPGFTTDMATLKTWKLKILLATETYLVIFIS